MAPRIKAINQTAIKYAERVSKGMKSPYTMPKEGFYTPFGFL
jgi:hypothetical protein